jgi:protein O-GlcNAc transferase
LIRRSNYVEGSTLWLLEDNAEAASNLRQAAHAQGISPHRLVFAKRTGLTEHLSRQGLSDLFLDTWPYGAHTNASDALWAGLPLMTCIGESFASRVAASLLTALDLPELITNSSLEYEKLAIELAKNVAKFQSIKDRLLINRHSAPLFQAIMTVRHIETAYTTIVERIRRNLAPHSISIHGAEDDLDQAAPRMAQLHKQIKPINRH